MSQKKRKKHKKTTDPCVVGPKQVLDFLAEGKTQQALELAKRLIKESPNLETESCLAQAYRQRIDELQKAGQFHDVKNLIDVAKSKCRQHQELFESILDETFQFPLSDSDVCRIVQSLEESKLEKTKAQKLKNILENGLSDPRRLLKIEGDSALKQEAAIVMNAFEAVEGDGPEDERMKRLDRMAQISRRSPLAAWCLWIRALHAYYSFEDRQATELLARIPDSSILQPAKTVILSKIQERRNPTGLSSKATRELWKSITSESVRDRWFRLSEAIDQRRRNLMRKSLRELLQCNWLSSPGRMRLMANSIIGKCMDLDFFDREIHFELQKAFERTWGEKGELLYQLDSTNLLALSDPEFAVESLETLEEEWRQKLSPEERAMILARAAAYARSVELEDLKPSFFFQTKNKPDHSDSIHLYKKASRLHPRPEYFEELFSLMQDEERKPKEIESVLMRWRDACKEDCSPLIHLFENAEKRGALKKALNFLEEAERLDRLNPKVRNARLRLVWHTALKHIKQKKYHLAERDLENLCLQDMPPAKQSLFEGIARFLSLCQDKPDPGAGNAHPTFSAILLHHIAYKTQTNMKKRLDREAPLEDLVEGDRLKAYYDLREALESINDLPNLPDEWFNRFPSWISGASHLNENLLLQISQTIQTNGLPEIVIAATGRGMERDSPRLHEFLFYRGLALWKDNPYEMEEYLNCILAVITLSRARGDYELERRALETYQKIEGQFMPSHFFDDETKCDDESLELSLDEVSGIIQWERDRTKPSRKKKRSKKKLRFGSKRMKNQGKTLMKMAQILADLDKNRDDEFEDEFEDEFNEDDDGLDDNQPMLW